MQGRKSSHVNIPNGVVYELDGKWFLIRPPHFIITYWIKRYNDINRTELYIYIVLLSLIVLCLPLTFSYGCLFLGFFAGAEFTLKNANTVAELTVCRLWRYLGEEEEKRKKNKKSRLTIHLPSRLTIQVLGSGVPIIKIFQGPLNAV
jgi:hypothetical protein